MGRLNNTDKIQAPATKSRALFQLPLKFMGCVMASYRSIYYKGSIVLLWHFEVSNFLIDI